MNISHRLAVNGTCKVITGGILWELELCLPRTISVCLSLVIVFKPVWEEQGFMLQSITLSIVLEVSLLGLGISLLNNILVLYYLCQDNDWNMYSIFLFVLLWEYQTDRRLVIFSLQTGVINVGRESQQFFSVSFANILRIFYASKHCDIILCKFIKYSTVYIRIIVLVLTNLSKYLQKYRFKVT